MSFVMIEKQTFCLINGRGLPYDSKEQVACIHIDEDNTQT